MRGPNGADRIPSTQQSKAPSANGGALARRALFSSPRLNLSEFIALRRSQLLDPALGGGVDQSFREEMAARMESLLRRLPVDKLDYLYSLARVYHHSRGKEAQPTVSETLKRTRLSYYLLLHVLVQAVFSSERMTELDNVALGVMGSTARGEVVPQSDIEFILIGRQGSERAVLQHYYDDLIDLAYIFELPVEGKGMHVFIEGEERAVDFQDREMATPAAVNTRNVSIFCDVDYFTGNQEVFDRFVSYVRQRVKQEAGRVVASLLSQFLLRPRQAKKQDAHGYTNGVLNLRVKKGAQRFFNVIQWIVRFTFDAPLRVLSAEVENRTEEALAILRSQEIISQEDYSAALLAFRRILYVRLRMTALKGDIVTIDSLQRNLRETFLQDAERRDLFGSLEEAADPVQALLRIMAADQELVKDILGKMLSARGLREEVLAVYRDKLGELRGKKSLKREEKVTRLREKYADNPAQLKAYLDGIGPFEGSSCERDYTLIAGLIDQAGKLSGRGLYEAIEGIYVALLVYDEHRYFTPIDRGQDPRIAEAAGRRSGRNG